MSENMESTPLPEENHARRKYDPEGAPGPGCWRRMWRRRGSSPSYESIRELIHPTPLPPLQVTSQPLAVKDIWGLYGRKKQSGAYSLAIHVSR
jgi:hypothetical protein